MILKSLLAAGAVAASLVAIAPAHQAQAGVNIDLQIGVPGYYPVYGYGYGYGYGDGYGYGYGHPVRHWDDAISCKKGKKIVKWNGFHKVNAVDCGLPRYKYTGWKSGHKYLVTVNRLGGIADVERIY